MRKFVIATLTAALFFCATSAMATSFYFYADNIVGTGVVNYDINRLDGYSAPDFTFTKTAGSVNSNMGAFLPGNYDIDISLTGLWIDANEDGSKFALGDHTFSLSSVDIPAIPPAGTFGALTYAITPPSLYLSYDFGTTGIFTNANVSQGLALADLLYSGEANGVMDAFIGWDSLKVDLTDTAPVPEPSTLLLLGAGIAGLAAYRRKKS